jgi:hypothetical protein
VVVLGSTIAAAIFFGVLDPATGSLSYINAGQEPPMVVGRDGVKARLELTGPVVGVFPDREFGIKQVNLEPDDVLLAVPDGVSTRAIAAAKHSGGTSARGAAQPDRRPTTCWTRFKPHCGSMLTGSIPMTILRCWPFAARREPAASQSEV